MIRAISGFFRKLGYLLSGKVDAAGRDLARNPHVIQATYDRVVQEKKGRINQYKDAVARMIAQEETKLARIKTLSAETAHLEKLKEGAAAKARTVVEQLRAQGQSMDQIKRNDEYVKCLAAFNDFSSTLKEKEEHIVDLERDVKDLASQISGHKVQLQALLRDVEKIKEEASATVADVITSREEEEINNMLVGIGQDRASEELQEMRDLRQQQKAKARISREMAGTDTKALENEFLEYARTGVATDEFDRLVGLAEEADKAPAQERSQENVRLPEA